jgi:hypothetical protein
MSKFKYLLAIYALCLSHKQFYEDFYGRWAGRQASSQIVRQTDNLQQTDKHGEADGQK